MSGNVHSNPGPIFPCSVCAGNVTWRGKSVQCCTCSKWVHLRCSQLSLSKFRALESFHSWSCLPCRNAVTLSSDSSDTYTSTVQSSPLSTNAALSPHAALHFDENVRVGFEFCGYVYRPALHNPCWGWPE